jgi:hypothetical protein
MKHNKISLEILLKLIKFRFLVNLRLKKLLRAIQQMLC